MKALKTTKPKIDWAQVSENYRYLARDADGRVFLYAIRPEITTPEWRAPEWWSLDDGTCADASVFKSLEVGTCDWRDSLVERPLQRALS